MAKIGITGTGSYWVTIPKELVKEKGWRAGTQLNFDSIDTTSLVLRARR
jgi:hypothetical protein